MTVAGHRQYGAATGRRASDALLVCLTRCAGFRDCAAALLFAVWVRKSLIGTGAQRVGRGRVADVPLRVIRRGGDVEDG